MTLRIGRKNPWNSSDTGSIENGSYRVRLLITCSPWFPCVHGSGPEMRRSGASPAHLRGRRQNDGGAQPASTNRRCAMLAALR
jgi:hypothetical protein